ncbi:allantoate amidohydrolase [Bacillus sp. MRMR6]|nr:allantoate amidohydrolase [Bacillus sp. MRMR6]
METLNSINEYGNSDQGHFRLAYTEEEQKAKQYLIQKCKDINMKITIDPVGNIIARRDGVDPTLPAVAIGSHLDTVYNGGRYDGALGVVAGLEVVTSLVEQEVSTLHPIEIIVFSCEESSRYNFSTLGSRAMIGDLDGEKLQHLKDRDDISLREAFESQNLILEDYKLAERNAHEIKVFFELHIEQGSKLIDHDKTIGLVTGIAAPLRLAITIEGKSSHSGTTGMKQRSDALLAAAELSLVVEKAAIAEEQYETVATVGVLDAYPSAMNVVPGLAKIKVDIRSTDRDSRTRVLTKVKAAIESIKKHRGVTISIDWMTEEEPVMLDQSITKIISNICKDLGISHMLMPSGAGHDAMNMAKRWPTSLVFVPSVDGLSHHPDEFTSQEDIASGVKLLEEVVKLHAIIVDEEGESSWKHVKSESSRMSK